jgi:hypothetical protein
VNRRLAVALYLGFWTAVAALVTYLVMAAGYSLWLGIGVAWALFFLVNGTLAYIHRSRQLRLQGEQPPSFPVFLLSPGARGFRSPVAVPKAVRLILGAVVLLGGAAFAVTGGLFLFVVDFSTVPHPIGARIMLAVFCALGLAFGYIGFRLLVMKNEERLFPRRTRAGAA